MFSIDVVVAVDAANVLPARVLLRSIRAHLPWWKGLRFFVVYSGGNVHELGYFDEHPNTRIIPLVIDNPFEKWGSVDYISAATLTRLLIPELLPRIGRVIYLDADTLALRDLSALYRTKLIGGAIGGVLDFPLLLEIDHGLHGTEDYLRETIGLQDPTKYVNAGVLVMDLHRLRAARFVERARDLLEQQGSSLKFRDQDVINALVRDHIATLDPRWNSMITMAHQPAFLTPGIQDAVALQQNDPFILHFAGPRKPWHEGYDGPHAGLWSGYQPPP